MSNLYDLVLNDTIQIDYYLNPVIDIDSSVLNNTRSRGKSGTKSDEFEDSDEYDENEEDDYLGESLEEKGVSKCGFH